MTGADLRAARERLGYSQAELAEALDVEQPHVSQWETGKHPVPHWVAPRLRRHETVQEATRMLAEGRVPECAELPSLRDADARAMVLHAEFCPVCTAHSLRMMWEPPA